MIKEREISTPTSCLNKAKDDEPIFVLRANDPLAPAVVACWAALAAQGLHEEWKVKEALALAQQMRDWRARR